MTPIEALLREIYGEVPKTTPGQEAWHELMIASGTFLQEQWKRDTLRLSIVALQTGDGETAAAALAR